MAEFNGTNAADNYGGTNEDDRIQGLGGNDFLSGAGGNDTIIGGDGADNLAGGSGDDHFGIEDTINGFMEMDGDVIDGGSDDDTLSLFINSLTTTIPFSITTSIGSTITDGVFSAHASNIEFVQILGTDQILTPGTASFLNLTDKVSGKNSANAVEVPIDPEYYGGTTLTLNAFSADSSKGLKFDGNQLFSGDTYETNLGEVTARFYAANGGYWTVELILPDALFYDVGYAKDFIVDQVIDVTFVSQSGDDFTTPISFGYNFSKDVDASDAVDSVFFFGDDQNSIIILGDFDDRVSGGDGNDTIYGGDGNDQIYAGRTDTGDDLLYGDAGNDTLGGAAGADIMFGGKGNDMLFGGSGNDQLFGEENNDVMWAGSGDDQVLGGTGNDIMGGGSGKDTMRGGSGSDTMYASDDDDIVDGNEGDDNIFSGDGDDVIDGGEDDDLIFNGGGNDTVYGGSGDDTLWGGAGNDMLYGGADNDTFAFTATTGADVVFDFELTGSGIHTGDVIDLSAFVATLNDPGGITYTVVIAEMSDLGSDVSLFLTPGNTVLFKNISVTDFQSAIPDWLILV